MIGASYEVTMSEGEGTVDERRGLGWRMGMEESVLEGRMSV